ncbi:lysoplasmalogenase family protein [Flavobacterium okayamense]|uniref:YhhN-like protein n=1 Tax=Flavobacterium okayamense TaxID=2830782 RepID=A0ABM7SEA1_9FLAO|nr:lysoplasmalogenase family protein [Flavobacterium okayamense]BCY29507.1 hypothetical protein KK2020170_23750 [Flavobacterium okayamense]
MNKSKVALQFFLVAGLLFLISIFFNLEFLELISKPAIIPSIVMYYFFEIKRKYNLAFLASLFLFFLGDMLYMLKIEELYYIGLLVFSVPYLFVIYFVIKDILLIKRNGGKQNDFTFLVILVILSILLSTVLSYLEIKSTLEFIIFLFLGLQLVTMGVLTSVVYYNEANKQSFFLILAVPTFIMSDLFFILNKNLHELMIFKIINGLTQTVSYMFYVKYFLERTK